MNAPINPAGIALLKQVEDFVAHAYPDPASPLGRALQARGLWRRYLAAPFPLPADLGHLRATPWTLGYGFTRDVREGDTMTRAQADARLSRELQEYVQGVRRGCTVEPTENQLAAMVVLAWNIGVPRFLTSTVLKAHNRGDAPAAARAFRLWNQAGGAVSPALERRRGLEAALYLTPDDGTPAAMPQMIESETPMRASSINRASLAAGCTAAVATVTETARSLADLRESVADLSDWLVPLLLVAVVALCAFIAWERHRQRREGWA